MGSRGGVRCLRDVHDGRVAYAWPVAVEGEGENHVVVSQRAGSVGMVPDGYPHDLRRVVEQAATGRWELVERAWAATDCLHVVQFDQWWGAR